MSIRTGITHTADTMAPPTDLRETAVGGRIYPVDPALAARLRAIVAEQEAGKVRKTAVSGPQRGIKRTASGVDRDLVERAERLRAMREAKAAAAEAEKEVVVTVKKEKQVDLTEAQVRSLHARYVDGARLMDLAEDANLKSRQNLQGLFSQYGLRSKTGGLFTRKQTAPPSVLDEEHAETAVSAPLSVLNVEHAPTPALPQGEREQEALSPALSQGEREQGLHEQLAALTALMEMAQAKQVSISGRIRLELVAEIEL